MRQVTLKLTFEELRLLATMASDQLFRREFIDPKMPSHRPNFREIDLRKGLVARLKLMVHEGLRRGEMDGSVRVMSER